MGLFSILVASFLLVLAPVGPVPGTHSVPILLYHHVDHHFGQWHVTPEKLDEELAYLSKNGFHTITMADYLRSRRQGTAVPDHSLVITFDDGNLDNYQYAYPLLKKYGMVATFFVVTGQVGHQDVITWGQLEEMAQNGMDIEAHTVSHPFLTQLSPAKAFLEIWVSRLELETHLQRSVPVFAYPYNDHNTRVVSLVELAGFQGACIVTPHGDDIRGNLFEIPRLTITSGEQMQTFILVTGQAYNDAITSHGRHPHGE